jgi:hypothetical protein
VTAIGATLTGDGSTFGARIFGLALVRRGFVGLALAGRRFFGFALAGDSVLRLELIEAAALALRTLAGRLPGRGLTFGRSRRWIGADLRSKQCAQ